MAFLHETHLASILFLTFPHQIINALSTHSNPQDTHKGGGEAPLGNHQLMGRPVLNLEPGREGDHVCVSVSAPPWPHVHAYNVHEVRPVVVWRDPQPPHPRALGQRQLVAVLSMAREGRTGIRNSHHYHCRQILLPSLLAGEGRKGIKISHHYNYCFIPFLLLWREGQALKLHIIVITVFFSSYWWEGKDRD